MSRIFSLSKPWDRASFRISLGQVQGVAVYFLHPFGIVVGDQRLVSVKLLQGPDCLDGIRVDDLPPDELLPFGLCEILDVPVNQEELRERGHVEARSKLVKGLQNGRVRIGLDGVVDLNAGQVPLELPVVAAQNLVVNHDQGRTMFRSQVLEYL
jgi:hypothetical protein